MRGLLNSELSFSNFINIKRSLNYLLTHMAPVMDMEGRWYRSQYYDRGWGYYSSVPGKSGPKKEVL